MSYKIEVETPTLPPVWVGNGMRFQTAHEAARYGSDLLSRWVVPTDYRVVEATEPTNYRMLPDGSLERISA